MVADPEDARAGAARRQDRRRDHDPRQHRDARLSQGAEGHRGHVPRRLAAHRRPRGRASRRLCRDQGSRQGHHHLRRREYFERRGGDRALQASGGPACRRGRAAGREMGRNALRLRAVAAGNEPHRGRDHHLLPRSAGALQERRNRWCSGRCRPRRPARSRNSCCGSGPARSERSGGLPPRKA